MRKFGFPSKADLVSIDGVGDPSFTVDTEGFVVNCNKAAAWLFGLPTDHIVGRRCFSIVRGCLPSGEPACSLNCPLIQGFGIQPGPPAVELVVRGAGHQQVPVVMQHIPLRDAHGRPSGLVHVMVPAEGKAAQT
jgi:hypothetical protein